MIQGEKQKQLHTAKARRFARTLRFRGVLLLLLFSSAAGAAGVGIPDLGAAALGQAGATVARPTDLTALYYNPGALGFLDGIQAYVDVRAIDQRVTFQRLDAQGQNPQGWLPVANSGGPALAPTFGVSWHKDIFTLAAGGHPYDGATGFDYPDPTTVTGSVARDAPQRYLAIEAHNRIYIPVLAAAVQIAPWVSVGAGLQLPIATFSTRQTVYAGPFAGELTDFDATLDLSAHQWFARSGVFGVSLSPLDWLDAGASLQLSTHFRASGTVAAQLPATAKQLGLTVTGSQVGLDLVFPWVARAGVRVHRGKLSVELAGTFEKWSQLQQIRVTPIDVAVHIGQDNVPLPNLVLEKNLVDAGSVRLGGEYRMKPWLAVRAGVLYETSAIPEERQALDWVDWQRFSLNAGFGISYGRADISLGFARFIQGDRQVRDSAIHQLTAFQVVPTIIGNGNYSSTLTLAALGISTKL